MSESNIVNRTTLSVIFGKNFSTIDAWVRQGMPFVKKGRKGNDWLFDTAKVIAWREAKLKDEVATPERIEYEEAKRRKIAAEAAILEIDLQLKRQAILLRCDVEENLSHTFITLKQRLRTIPERISAQLTVESDEYNVRELLLTEIDDALFELSNCDYNATASEQT